MIKKEGLIEDIEDKNEVDRSELTLQTFFNEMSGLGAQLQDKDLNKPVFHYGDLGVTNYLLWLILGELTILNDKEKENA